MKKKKLFLLLGCCCILSGCAADLTFKEKCTAVYKWFTALHKDNAYIFTLRNVKPNILGPFKKDELRDSALSIAHFEKDKILFMDFSSCYKNIDSFKWKEYKEYINYNKHEVDFIAFSISPDEIFLTSNILHAT